MADTTKGTVMRRKSLPRLVSLVVLLALMLTALPASVMAQNGNGGNRGGNSANARACEQNGWASLYRISDGSGFANQDECVSYGAQGGTLIDSNTRQCFHGAMAPAQDPTAAFADLSGCLAYGLGSGLIVPWTPPDNRSVRLTWFPEYLPYCGATITVTGFTDGQYQAQLSGLIYTINVEDGTGSVNTWVPTYGGGFGNGESFISGLELTATVDGISDTQVAAC